MAYGGYTSKTSTLTQMSTLKIILGGFWWQYDAQHDGQYGQHVQYNG